MTDNNFSHIPTGSDLLDKIRGSIGSYISGKRLEHTFSVEEEAVEIAKIMFPVVGVDEKYISDIRAAALLHDMTKQFSLDEQIAVCKDYNLPFSSDSAVLHSRTGAYAARRDFGINDTVFGAIYCHTTGKADMNIFEKIIFISDYIEKTRTHSSCIKARNYFYENIGSHNKLLVLNKTILISIDATVRFLLDKESAIDIETINSRNSILKELVSDTEVQQSNE